MEIISVKNTYHSISAQDLKVTSEMQKQLSAIKGKIEGPEARKPFDDVMKSIEPPAKVNFLEDEVNGVNGWWCLPNNHQKKNVIVYFHGGAYNVGSAKAYRNFVGNISELLNTSVFIPEYRLAPENPYPAAVQDAECVYYGVVERGYSNITLMGDSAGGGLALVLTQITTERMGFLKPSSIVVFSPWTDLNLDSTTFQSKANEDILLVKESLRKDALRYLKDASPLQRSASPLYGELKGLPPIQIHVGEAEVLLGDSLRFSKKAVDEGSHISLHIWEGMPHVFVCNLDKLTAANLALAHVAAFVKEWNK